MTPYVSHVPAGTSFSGLADVSPRFPFARLFSYEITHSNSTVIVASAAHSALMSSFLGVKSNRMDAVF